MTFDNMDTGAMNNVPRNDAAVDVVISNCVINLQSGNTAVFAGMHRVLHPGGRIGIAGVVAEDAFSEADRLERGSWVGYIAGAFGFDE